VSVALPTEAAPRRASARWRRVRNAAGRLAVVYLVLGALLAVANDPGDIWKCHVGERTVTGNHKTSTDCAHAYSVGARATLFGLTVVFWLPVLALKAGSPD
jgi:hypothetical protein